MMGNCPWWRMKYKLVKDMKIWKGNRKTTFFPLERTWNDGSSGSVLEVVIRFIKKEEDKWMLHFNYIRFYKSKELLSSNILIIQKSMFIIIKHLLHYQISRVKFAPEPGFEARTSRSLAWRSTWLEIWRSEVRTMYPACLLQLGWQPHLQAYVARALVTKSGENLYYCFKI